MNIRDTAVSFFIVVLMTSISVSSAFGQSLQTVPSESQYKALLAKAKGGDTQSQYLVAKLYEQGSVVAQDFTKAFEWFSKSAKAGNPEAMTDLGVYYANGRVVEQDREIASSYYQAAADQGVPRAQFNLAAAYMTGRGVNRDTDRARELYYQAADQGFAPAQSSLGQVYQHGIGVKKDYKKALKWLQKADEQGFVTASYSLAGLYTNGHGVKKDTTKAFALYQKAADQGHAPSIYNLGIANRDGLGNFKVNPSEAVSLFNRAAQQGHASSQYVLGQMVYAGVGVKQSKEVGLKLISDAAAQGFKPALDLVTKLNNKGEATESSEVESVIANEESIEDKLLMLWSTKEAILSYFDLCIAEHTDSIAKNIALQSQWNKKNRKEVSKVDKYFTKHLESNKNDLGEGQTVESALAQLKAGLAENLKDDIVGSSSGKAVCNNLEQPIGEMTLNFKKLFKQERKLLRKTFN